jgi:predicted alpha/beta superfamily hydrolase
MGWRCAVVACAAACGGGTWNDVPAENGFVLHSTTVGDDFEIHVIVPAGYEDTADRYPVVYFLDAYDTQIGLVRERLVDLPAVIAVGIGYPGSDHRNRDYAFPADPVYPESGGADRFYTFLDTELLPSIDADYRSDGQRVLVGHSLGGYFTTFALLQTTSTHRPFSGFVALSPALQLASGWIFGLEAEVAQRETDMAVALYTNVGEIESAYFNAYFDELVARLGSRSYPSFRLMAERVPEANHCCTETPGWSAGLPFVLQ